MSEVKELNYDDLEPQSRVVSFRKNKYILTEASADAAAKYRNASMKSMRTNEAGKIIGVEGLADGEIVLVSQCLFYADKNGELRLDEFGNPDRRHLVPEAHIRGWPNKIQKDLYEAVKEMSPSIVEKAPESADPKGSQTGTPDTSV